MTQTVGLLLVFLCGFLITVSLVKRLSLIELLGLAFPLGYGYKATQMFLLDLANIDLRELLLPMAIDAALILLLGYIFRQSIFALKDHFDFRKVWRENKLHLAWVFFFGLTVYVLYVLLLKTMFWPVSTYDSIVGGYDRIARAIFAEGTFHNSVFDPVHPMTSVRSLYPPLVPYVFAHTLLIGFSHSQLPLFLFTFSTLVVIYGFMVKYTTHFVAMLLTFLLLVTPEYLAFSSLSSNNPPTTCYISLGLVALYIWFDTNERKYFALGTLMLALGSWSRSESILFAVAGGLLPLIKFLQNRNWKDVLVYGAVCLLPLIIWQLYMAGVLQVERAQPIITKLYWDGEKFGRLTHKLQYVTFNTQYYGLIVYAFLAMVVLNLKFTIQQKDRLALLGMIVFAWFLFVWLYYQLNTDLIEPDSTGWIGSGYKRGFFSFLPVMVFYMAVSKFSLLVFKKYMAMK